MANISCPRCRRPLKEITDLSETHSTCLGCNAAWSMTTFPALFRPEVAAPTGERILVETEASCFHHPQKKAVSHCHSCGRFLCSLCEIELGREQLCPNCFEARKKDPGKPDLLDRRARWDVIAATIALGSMVCYPFLVVGVPAALGIVFWQWRKPQSIVHKVGVSFLVAFLLAIAATLELGLLVFVIYSMLDGKRF